MLEATTILTQGDTGQLHKELLKDPEIKVHVREGVALYHKVKEGNLVIWLVSHEDHIMHPVAFKKVVSEQHKSIVDESVIICNHSELQCNALMKETNQLIEKLQHYLAAKKTVVRPEKTKIIYKRKNEPELRNSIDIFLGAIIGWPGVGLFSLLAVAGLILRSPLMLVIAAITSAPFSLYIFAASNKLPGTLSLIIPIMLVIGGYAIKQSKMALAWVSLIPILFIVLPLAVAVINQPYFRWWFQS